MTSKKITIVNHHSSYYYRIFIIFIDVFNELSKINFFLKFLQFMSASASTVVCFISSVVVSNSFEVVDGFTFVVEEKKEWAKSGVI